MIYTAEITDKANAPKIRRQLHKAGFSYNKHLKIWRLNSMSIKGARIDLPKVKAIEGIKWERLTHDQHMALIRNAQG